MNTEISSFSYRNFMKTLAVRDQTLRSGRLSVWYEQEQNIACDMKNPLHSESTAVADKLQKQKLSIILKYEHKASDTTNGRPSSKEAKKCGKQIPETSPKRRVLKDGPLKFTDKRQGTRSGIVRPTISKETV
jgi:hypothetical protein